MIYLLLVYYKYCGFRRNYKNEFMRIRLRHLLEFTINKN